MRKTGKLWFGRFLILAMLLSVVTGVLPTQMGGMAETEVYAYEGNLGPTLRQR